MRTEIFRRLAGVVCAAALVWLAVPVVPAQADEVELTEAVLRWGLNNEANNRSPQGRMNFLSAGQIPKPADGELRETGWSQSAGLVSIEKWNGKTYQPATWAGLSTDAGGKPISGFMSGSYTGHQTVFRGGQGTVDRDAGTAHIEWQGSAGNGDVVDVDVAAVRWGNTSFELGYAGSVEGRPVFTSTVLYVSVQLGTTQTMPTPVEVVEAFGPAVDRPS